MGYKKPTDWRRHLPKGYAAAIRKKLKLTITEKAIYNIVAGHCEDNHGVKPLALTMAETNKKHQAELKKRLRALA